MKSSIGADFAKQCLAAGAPLIRELLVSTLIIFTLSTGAQALTEFRGMQKPWSYW